MHEHDEINRRIQRILSDLRRIRAERVRLEARIEGLDVETANHFAELARLRVLLRSMRPYDPRMSEHWAA